MSAMAVPLTFISLVALTIGYKLLLRPAEIPVTYEELRKRVVAETSRKEKISLSPIVIYLCGIDGSGKTTQVDIISNCLANRNIPHTIVWLRWVALVSYPFLALCRLLGYTAWKVNKNSVRYPEHYFYRNKAVSRIWVLIFTVDMLLHAIVRVRIPLMMKRTVLCDRFVLDSLVDLACETKNKDLFESRIGRLLISILPRRCLVIMLDVSEQEAIRRKRDIPSIEYLEGRRELYFNLASNLGVPILDGNKPSQDLHKSIVSGFLSHLPLWYVPLTDQSREGC
jgi:thymidylate kinase